MTVAIDWDKLGFGLTPTKTMFLARTKLGERWSSGHLLPFGEFSISPAAGVLNYGQGIFEGMKALRTVRNEIALFRPRDNAERFMEGAKQLCMPPVPIDFFIENIKQVVRENIDYLPPFGKGSLYIRPCLWGTGAILGVAPAPEYTFLIYTSPVGSYFSEGLSSIRVLVSESFDRAAPQGTGNIKYIGNYAGTLSTLQKAKSQGFSNCLYLDARTNQNIEEVGAANFFCIVENVLLTPRLGSILPGVTRDSVIRIARDVLKMKVEESDISMDIVEKAKECFCVGTAAIVTPISGIGYAGREMSYSKGPVTKAIHDLLNAIQKGEEEDIFGWVDIL